MARNDITNGQVLPASFDVKDEKEKRIAALPSGATFAVTSSNEQVAQWAADPLNPNPSDPFVGMVTTLNDDIGDADLVGVLTLPDGSTKQATLEVRVVNSAPAGEATFTAGTPRPE